MARKGGSKEGLSHDPSLSMPTEQRTSESNKQKISKIHETFPTATKDMIAKILQFYDDDESKVIDAITRDGGQEALTHVNDTGSLKNKNNKNKKKKKKPKRESVAEITTTASFDADDSSSLHSSGNVDADMEKESQTVGNGFLPDISDEIESMNSTLTNHERLQSAEEEPLSLNLESRSSVSTPDVEVAQSDRTKSVEKLNEQCDSEKSGSSPIKQETESTPCASPLSENSEKQEDVDVKRDRNRPSADHYKNSPRQRTSSFRRSKTSSLSEDSSSQHTSQNITAKRGVDRCKKDLNRQNISLQRIHSQVEKGFEDSAKKVKTVFADLVKLIENRKKEIDRDLEKSKEEALKLIKSRQDLAIELKRRVDRSPSMTDGEWSELRSDIKLFVTERKFDDELGKTIWFQWSDISDNIKSFGEVQPVKNMYSQRSSSVLAHNDPSQMNNPEPSPSSSLANEEIDYAADKSDVAVISDAVEEGNLGTTKEEETTVNKTKHDGNRTLNRVFSNKNFQHQYSNRFQGRNRYQGENNRFRGNRRPSGNYPRPYNRNYANYGNRYNNEEYRQHSFQDRDRINDNHSYPNDRNNMNYYKNDRGRQHPTHRFNNYNRNYNRDQNRHNIDNANSSTAEPSTKSAEAAAGKPAVVNGVENN